MDKPLHPYSAAEVGFVIPWRDSAHLEHDLRLGVRLEEPSMRRQRKTGGVKYKKRYRRYVTKWIARALRVPEYQLLTDSIFGLGLHLVTSIDPHLHIHLDRHRAEAIEDPNSD